MKKICIVTMTSTDGSTFAINDINEISKHYNEVFLFPLKKDLIFKRKPIYNRNVKVIRKNVNKIDVKSDFFYLLITFFSIFKIILLSRDSWVEKIKQLILLPKSILISNYINKLSPENVHLFWGHYPSLVILGLNKNLNSKISIFMGAYDLRKKLDISRIAANKSEIIFTHVKKNINLIGKLIGNKNKIQCIYRGVKFDEFKNINLEDKKKLSFCTIGLLEKHKNINQIIRSFSVIKKRYKDATLTIIGHGSLENKLKKQVKNLNLIDSVSFTGWISRAQISNILKLSQFYLHFSIIEALPNSIKEAMYSKCYCLSSNTFGIEEIIEDKKNGFIINPEDNKEMLKTIEFCLNSDTKSEILNNAQLKIIKNFDLAKNIKSFCDTI